MPGTTDLPTLLVGIIAMNPQTFAYEGESLDVQIIAVRPARKSPGVVPHSTRRSATSASCPRTAMSAWAMFEESLAGFRAAGVQPWGAQRVHSATPSSRRASLPWRSR